MAKQPRGFVRRHKRLYDRCRLNKTAHAQMGIRFRKIVCLRYGIVDLMTLRDA